MTEFYRGGGTIADTISGVPDAIDKMLGNYKKIAIIDNAKYNITHDYVNQDIPNISEPLANTKIVIQNINLDFKPKFFIMHMETTAYKEEYKTSICIDTRRETNLSLIGAYLGKIFKENIVFNENTITIYRKLDGIYARRIDVIAIE